MVMNTTQGILSAAEQLSAFTGDNIHIAYMIGNRNTKRGNTRGIEGATFKILQT
jgi:hypothetical protein